MSRSISHRRLAFILAMLSAVGPFSIDTYLPSFPAIGAAFGASAVEVQQTLTAYLLPFSVMMLWHGAISDALGRRPVILVALALFGCASLGCVVSTRIEHLWLLRAAQGVTAGAGMIVGRAIVRDVYEGADAQRLMAHIAIMFALAPAVAPIIGGALQAAFGWRAVFFFLAALSLAMFAICWRWLPETLPAGRRQSLHPGELARAYARVLTDPPFMTACGAIALNFAGFFIYVLSAPVFLMRHLGVSAQGFAWLFLPAMAGMMGGSWLSGALAGRRPALAAVRLGYLLMAGAAAGNLALNLLLPPALPWPVLPIPFYTFGMALAMPNLTLLALDRFPRRRGLAASCQGFIQTGINTAVAGLVAPLLWATTLRLAAGMAAMLTLGGLAALAFRTTASGRWEKVANDDADR